MSVASEISRLTTLRNRIRTKLISLGALSDVNADLEDCTDAIENMTPSQGTLVYATTSGTAAKGQITFEMEVNSLQNVKTIYFQQDTDSQAGRASIRSAFALSIDLSNEELLITCWTSTGSKVNGYAPFTFEASGQTYELTVDKPNDSSFDNFQYSDTYTMYYTYINGANISNDGGWDEENSVED